ncbi:MAG: serine/threonine protein kinase [Candidatus Cryptobacteroides sp.]
MREVTRLKNGATLQGGKYRILSVLGQGGFGITYEAEQVALGRRVAVKEFFMEEYCNRDGDTSQVSVPSVGSKETVERFRAKFVKEAKMIAGLNNPHIVKIHDVFEENGTAYYVMEYHDKGSLKDEVANCGALPEIDAVKRIREVADALQYLHNQNILHLDVKPGNVLRGDNGEMVLIDFGVSNCYDEEGEQTSSTPVAKSKGYAPSELYISGSVSHFSPATDIYSLGATFYHLVTGMVPPDASIVSEEGIDLSKFAGLSKPTRNAIESAMQSKRKDRPQSIAEFLN